MPDDRKNDPVQSDFDDWLADEDSAPTDPTVRVDDSETGTDVESEIDEDVELEPVVAEATEPADDVEPTPDPVEMFEPIEDSPDPDQAVAAAGQAFESSTSEASVIDTAENPFLPMAETDHDNDETTEMDGSDESVEEMSDGEDPTDEPIDEDSLHDDEPEAETASESIFDESVFDTGETPVDDRLVGDHPVVEFDAFDGGHERITGEMEIIVPEVDEPDEDDFGADDSGSFEQSSDHPVVIGFDQEPTPTVELDPPFDFGEVAPAEKFDPFDDTGEAVFVTGETPIVGGVIGGAVGGTAGVPERSSLGGASFAELWGVEDVTTQPAEPSPGQADVSEDVGAPPSDDDFDPIEYGTDDFQRGQTREHAGLAELIAAAETEETEKVALVAAIPGLESSVVGFEDVVEAEGHRKVRARGSGDLVARVTTGVILVAALAASLFWRPALLLLAMAVFVLGAGEFYTALVRHDRKPIALFGFIGIVAACLGAYAWSAAAIPMAFVLAAVLLLLFYAVTPGRPDPMGNLALTTTVMVWAGLGSFAMLIARSDDYQVLILGVVVTVAGADIAAFFVGRSIGRTHFAPWVSPKKTVEGLVAGVIVAVGLGAVLHFFPPFELTSGLAVGAAAAVLTPLGDLAMSAAKRMLGLKDMGSVLPGHGGFLDRIDGLLFAIPAAWAIFVWAGLL